MDNVNGIEWLTKLDDAIDQKLKSTPTSIHSKSNPQIEESNTATQDEISSPKNTKLSSSYPQEAPDNNEIPPKRQTKLTVMRVLSEDIIDEDSDSNWADEWGDDNEDQSGYDFESLDSYSTTDTLEEPNLTQPISWNPNDYIPYNPDVNCHGIVHVRIHKCYALPCMHHSNVHAQLSLYPWKGMIKTCKILTRKSTFSQKDDSLFVSNLKYTQIKSSQFLHAYNNPETPIPKIKIEFVITNLSILATKIASVNISVLPLMMTPGIWHHSWFSIDNASISTNSFNNNDIPIDASMGEIPSTIPSTTDTPQNQQNRISPKVLLDLCFQPSHMECSAIPPYLENKIPLEVGGDVSPSTIFVPSNEDESDRLQDTNDNPNSDVEEKYGSSNLEQNDVNSTNNDESTNDNLPPLSPSSHQDTVHSEHNNHEIQSITPSTTYTLSTHKPPTQSHLFRIQNYYAPAYCSVCSSLLWIQNPGYKCELCHLTTCEECQLQSNVRYPCGSQKSEKFITKTWRYQMENLRILDIVAPKDAKMKFGMTLGQDESESEETRVIKLANRDREETTHSTEQLSDRDYDSKIHTNTSIKSNLRDTTSSNDHTNDGIGTLNINIIKACILDIKVPSETSISELLSETHASNHRPGDYYVRIHTTNLQSESLRTTTVYQSSKPHFDSNLHLSIPDYGMEFRIDLIDAISDKPIGSTLLSAQAILQRQRDFFMRQDTIDRKRLLDWRRSIDNGNDDFWLELRTGSKRGFGLEFFNHSEDISGWIHVNIKTDIHPNIYALDQPQACPSRSTPDFNIELIQLHISRIGTILSDLKSFFGGIQYLLNWDEPALTGLLMIIFVFTCLRFNAEYIASLPLLFLIGIMMHLWNRRRSGKFEKRWVEKERDARIQAEKKLEISYKIHRPCAKIKAMVTKGRNLRSRELGLPGSLNVSLTYDPLRLLTEKQKKDSSNLDGTSSFPHNVGVTHNSNITANPEWEKIAESDESRRLKLRLSQSNVLKEESDPDAVYSTWDKCLTFTFPILQPLTTANHIALLLPWKSSPSALVFQVRFDHLFNKIPVFDNILGEVSIPFVSIMNFPTNSPRHFEIEGWFEVKPVGSIQSTRLAEKSQTTSKAISGETKKSTPKNEDIILNDIPSIYLRIKLTIPEEKSTVSEIEKESSIVIAEEMIRNAEISKNVKASVIGSSLNTINTVRGLGGNLQGIQNQLGDILDVVEKIRNLLNWSSPQQSMLAFGVMSILWLVLFLVPARILILCAGLGIFIGNFYRKYGTNKPNQIVEEKDENASPIPILINNFFHSIPNDEDLRRVYYWESRREGEIERKKHASKKRSSRLRILWSTLWFGDVKIKNDGLRKRDTSNYERDWEWVSYFAIIQGHQFSWWKNEKSFDDGDEPQGKIMFGGHSGLASLSPLELRKLHKHEIQMVVNIFGKAQNGQKKISLLVPDINTKESIEYAVIKATRESMID